MTQVLPNATLKQYQQYIEDVYGTPNQRDFDLSEMLSNTQRFAMRALKGIRKNDPEKIKINLLITLSWYASILNRLRIDLEAVTWKRFPYICSYCGSCPCTCKEKKVTSRQSLAINESMRPKTINDYQIMFEKIYPAKSRTLEHAGVHLAEELGEFSEAIVAFRGHHKNEYFDEVMSEGADIFSCLAGVFNSLDVNMAEEIAKICNDNCHVCHKAPCECGFDSVMKYKS